MSGVRIYSIYLNNMVKDIDGYALTKNLNSSEISISDLSDVAKDLDDMLYLSDTLVASGEPSLVRSYSFLKRKLPLDSRGIILSDMGVNMVSSEVLKYCGSLLESDKVVNTKELGRLFKDISDGLTSANALSEQLLGDIYSNIDSDIDDEYEDDDYDLDDDLSEDVETYGISSDNSSDYYLKTEKLEELEYNSYASEQSIIEGKDNSDENSFDLNYEDEYSNEGGFSTDSLYSNPSLNKGYYRDNTDTYSNDTSPFKERSGIDIENKVLNDDFALNYSGDGNINDKLAYAISKVSKQISKTPSKVKEGSKVVYSNMVDFDS